MSQDSFLFLLILLFLPALLFRKATFRLFTAGSSDEGERLGRTREIGRLWRQGGAA